MATVDQTQQLYVTYFGRPADPDGLGFWTTGASRDLPLGEVADYFAENPEFAQTIEGKTTRQIVNSFYVNIFGRNADAPGLAYWVAKVDNGEISLQDVGLYIGDGALVQPPGSPDRVALESKIAASNLFTSKVGASTEPSLEYAGSLAATYGVEYLVPVKTNGTIPTEQATQLFIEGLPPVNTVGLLSSTVSSVDEGGTVIFTITTIPDLSGKTLSYQLGGVVAADVVGGQLAGTVVVSQSGVAVIQVTIASDNLIEIGEILTISFPNDIIFAQPTGSETVFINDTTVPTLQVQASAASVNEGGVLSFAITSTNLPAGTVISYDLSGVGLTPADVSNAPLTGTATLNAQLQATVAFNISNDLKTEGPESVLFVVEAAGVTASVTSVINDTSGVVVPNDSFVLTTLQDIVAGTAVPLFGFIGNEQTLGQGDRLSVGLAEEAILEVDVAGEFNLANFSTSGIETLQINGDGVQAVGNSSVALSNTDIRSIFIERAIQNNVLFDDLQIDDLFASITDSIGNFEFNFDASELNTGDQSATIFLDEIPVDQDDKGVGLYFSQAGNNAAAELEQLIIGSFNTSGDLTTNFVNVVSKISVGDALETLIISGTTSLDIDRDLGLPGSFANPFITLIDAEGLAADLSLAYTTEVQDLTPGNTTPDVSVIGAEGDNFLSFASTGPLPADFGVTTFDGDDIITTTIGDDSIDAGEGDNSVNAGDGTNEVTAGDGDNTVITGLGNDLIVLGDGDNSVTAGAGDDGIEVGDGDNTVIAGEGDNDVVAGDGDNEIVSGAGEDNIFAGIGSNVIRAGDGDNVVKAGVELDGTPLNAGDNKVITGSGIDTVDTGNGDDIIVVGDGEDFSADTVNSNGGDDLVITGNGDDVVNSGSGNDNVAVGEGTVTIDLGLDSDALWMKADNIEGDDFINGGSGSEAAGIRDSIIFTAGGTILRSETEGVTNIEEFVLLNLEDEPVTVSDHADVQLAFEETVVGPLANYDVALSNTLVDGSNDLSGGVRRFTVDATEAFADVTVDLTPISSRDTTPQRNLIGISYFGSSDGYTETLIVSDQQLNARLIAKFDGLTGPDVAGDILEIVDTTDATIADLRGISGLDVIDLNASVNTAQTFTITLDQAFINANASPTDPIIIRATNGLPAGSRLNLNVSAVTSSGLTSTRSIVVEKTSNLIVTIVGDPLLGQSGAKVQVVDAFFLTSNSDDINGTIGNDLILVGSADDLNPSDNINAGAGFDTMLFEFGVADGQVEFGFLDFTSQPPINPFAAFADLTGYVTLLGAFDLDKYDGMLPTLPLMLGLPFQSIAFIDEAITQVTNLLSTPVPVDPDTFEGIQGPGGNFLSSSQPDSPGGVAIAGLPFPGFVTPTGQTLESQLDFIRVENVEKYVFNPTNDNGVRFVGFNSLETFETPGFDGPDFLAQQGQLDLLSLEILQTFDSNRSPNAGADFALIEGNGAPLNDILFLDDFSWNINVTTDAENFWDNTADDLFVVNVADFSPVGFQGDYDFDRYVFGTQPNNDFFYGSFFDSDTDLEAAQQRRSAGSTALDFALEVNTGAGNDYIFRTVIGDSANGLETGTIVNGHYLAGYLVDSGSGDDVVVMDDLFYSDVNQYHSLWVSPVEQYGLFGGYNINEQFGDTVNVFYQQGNPFYDSKGGILAGEDSFADDVILTRSGNDFVVDYGGDNVVYSGIGNDYVLTGYGNDFIISDDDDELDATTLESEIGAEAVAGPASTEATDNDIILADGPLVGSYLQFSPQYNPVDSEFFLLGQVSPGVFGQDYVRDLTGDNIISTGGNDDTVVTGLGDDIVLAGSLGDLDEVGIAYYSDSDVINDLGGHNLIVTLGDSDYIESGDGSDVILAGFGNDDDVVFAAGGSDLIEIAAGEDYVDAGDGNDLIASLLGASSSVLSLQDGDWNGISTGDTLLGGDGIDSVLLAFGGSQDDIVIAPRLVVTSNPDGTPQTLSAVPNPGSYPASYADASNGDDGSVNPILDSLENLILFSDDADIYLTDTVAKQAGNLVEVAPGVFADQVSVFLNDLEYDGLGSGVNIVLDASAFEADSSLRAFAYNIGASSLQDGIQASAGLIGGSGIDFLAAGSFLESGILEGEALAGVAGTTDIASLIDEIGSFLDNQALDNFVGADVSAILSTILDGLGNGAADLIQVLLPLYPQPGENSVAQIQASLDLISGIIKADFVEDFITYQGNGGGDFITLEPTLLDPEGDPIVPENTVEFVRYETVRDGANAGVASGFDQVFNFNNTDTNLPYNDIDPNVATGELTNSYQFAGLLPTTTSKVLADGGAFDDIAGDKIVLGGTVGQLGDIVSKNGNQLVDLFKVNAAVNWSAGRTTAIANSQSTFASGDEALFVDYAIQITNDQITNFSSILGQINSFGTIVTELNQGGLIVVNGGDKAIYGVYQELDNNFASIAQSEFSILGVVQGIDTNSFRLQASDFIIDNSFVSFSTSSSTPSTPNVPFSGNIFDSQSVTDPFIPTPV